ncbi:hypothetical protein DPEC_G00370600 [Dallia pectoralis]|nr:hypothetical protein DPEC_G00370600 [Dallia pectoralis]
MLEDVEYGSFQEHHLYFCSSDLRVDSWMPRGSLLTLTSRLTQHITWSSDSLMRIVSSGGWQTLVCCDCMFSQTVCTASRGRRIRQPITRLSRARLARSRKLL